MEEQGRNRSYRRGAIMGLTMAEAFVLVAFALLLLFAFWRWEVDQENTGEVQRFKEIPVAEQRQLLELPGDQTFAAYLELRAEGFDFGRARVDPETEEKWRFIDSDDLRALNDAATKLPPDVQRDLADLVEADKAKEILSTFGAIETILNDGESLDTLKKRLEALRALDTAGEPITTLLEKARAFDAMGTNDSTLKEIAGKIQAAELREARLVRRLEKELGAVIESVGGTIDGRGAITLPETVLFAQGQSAVRPELRRFLSRVCDPWLRALRDSGVAISEVKIEGHASSEWQQGSNEQDAYLGNLGLSQRRSQSVLRECLALVQDSDLRGWARRHLVAVGYSSVRPVLRDGREDKAASRRVVLSASPDREQLISDIGTEVGQANDTLYDRAKFGDWADEDGDCRNTRHELLAEMSTGNVRWSEDGCYVISGQWRDPYTDKLHTNARDLEIDHLVSLGWAWKHGAAAWDAGKRAAFMNDPANLFAVEVAINRSKGASDPTEWLPPNTAFHCQYAIRFQRIAVDYGLVMNNAEKEEIRRMVEEAC